MGATTSTAGAAARRFFVTAVVVYAAACGGASLLIRGLGPVGGTGMPAAFLSSTLLLLAGSWQLDRAVRAVRRERQRPFKAALLAALGLGTAFVAVQSYALWCLLQKARPEDVGTGATPFVFCMAALHGMHFTVALLFLILITVRAFADRYDHEYYWGVLVCAYFWHVLGLAWGVLLGVLWMAY